MPRELNVISTPTSGGSDACTYMWACAICDENESCQKDKEGHSRWLVAKRMERIEHKVLIMSNKGGVGKSTMTTNLAVSLALKGHEVGICDMDIHGPNIPKMVGAEGQKLKISSTGGIIPFQAYNLKIASMSFLLQNSDDPIIWRDAYKYEFINQLLGGVTGAVIVTTPQEVALLDSRKSVTFCKDSEVPIIGIVENMSGLDCPHCGQHIEVFRKGGGEASALDMGVPFLGRVPLDPEVVTQCDAGEPFAMFYSDTPTAEAYHSIANKVDAFCKKSGSLLGVMPKHQH